MMTLEQVKSKSTKHLVGLHPVVLAAATALIERCYAQGVNIVITQGLRTIAEQDALYAQGRTKPGNIVTNAKGGTSYHNFGLAIDFALLIPDGFSVSWNTTSDGDGDGTKDWSEVVQEAKALGFEWGGDFVSIKDAPHFQMSFGLTTAKLRAGKQPTAAQTEAVYALINKNLEVDEEMTAEEKKDFEAMKVLIKAQAEVTLALTNRVADLEKRLNISGKETYYKGYTEAIEAAKGVKAITSYEDKSKLELNIIQLLFNLGLFKKGDK